MRKHLRASFFGAWWLVLQSTSCASEHKMYLILGAACSKHALGASEHKSSASVRSREAAQGVCQFVHGQVTMMSRLAVSKNNKRNDDDGDGDDDDDDEAP